MGKRFLVGLFLSLFLLSAGMAGRALAQEVVRVGVLPFRVYSPDLERQRTWPARVANWIATDLGKDERILTVEEGEIRKGLEEAGKIEGEERLAREVGRRVGADYMVVGSITQIDGTISLDIRILDVYREGILSSVFAVGKSPEELESVVRQASRELNIKILKKELISKVLVEGNRAIEESAIRAQIKTQEGNLYSPSAIREDLRAIYAMGYFQDVRVEMRDWDRRKAVAFVVDEKPIIKEVKFSGNKDIKTSDLLEVVNVKPRTVLNLNTVNEDVGKILKKYHEEAYFSAEVVYDLETPRRGDVIVHYKIKENKKIRIRRITFTGNMHFSDETLRKQLGETKEKNIFSWFSKAGNYREEALEKDLDGIIAFYLLKGFLDIKVGKPRVTTDPGGIIITVPVEEGLQFKMAKVDIQGDLIAPKDELLKLVPVYVGEIFNREKVRQSISNLTDRYADEGYAFVDVSPHTVLQTGAPLVDLTLDIRKGNKVYFERINITGNTRTRDRVIRRDLETVEGELYSGTALKKSRENLNYLQYFKEVNITTQKGSADDKMVLNVQVEEAPTGSFSVGAGYSTIDKLIGIVTVQQNNLFGRGQSIVASGMIGSISQYYTLSFTEPRLFDSRVLTGADLFNTYRDFDDYSVKRLGGQTRFGVPLFERFRAYFQYRYERDDVYNIKNTSSGIIKSMQGLSSTSSIYGGLQRDTRDQRFDPSKGSSNGVSIEYAGGFLGGSNYFTKYQASTAWFTSPFWGLNFSARGVIDYIHPNSGHAIPLQERFLLGGIYSLRGFKAYSVGPKTPAGESIGGDKALLFNLEMTFPIAKEIKLKGLFFFDAGNAWDVGQPYRLDDLRTSAGVGVRWISPMGPLRLEWGYNLHPRAGEAHSSWEFTIGTAF